MNQRGRFLLDERLASIQGKRLPNSKDPDAFPELDVQNAATRASIIRGIRCHHAFATSVAVTDLCAHHMDLVRARNARLIMSNVIPNPEDMSAQVHEPYCIWYPDFASEDTYRALVQQFPSMRYQVGRACAAAGFDVLYAELDILPDVSIAEEARESEAAGARVIYDAIMASPCRYKVMDDDILAINVDNPCSPAFLNGDTDVRWKLELRHGVYRWSYGGSICPEPTLCIEEDLRIGEDDTKVPKSRKNLTPEEVKLLYTPLPQDLPTVKKKLLVQMAAYDGNIDRYVRLTGLSPVPMGRVEQLCVIRGIYHHTMFARFWALEIERNSPRIQRLSATKIAVVYSIKTAVSARRIMINDTQEFDRGWDTSTHPEPFLIWWPLRPSFETLHALLDKAPSMKTQVAIAAIMIDDHMFYKFIDHPPHPYLWLAAQNSPNPYYRQDLERKAAEQGIDLDDVWGDPISDSLQPDLEPTDNCMNFWLEDGLELNTNAQTGGIEQGPYDNGAPLPSLAEKHVWATPDLLRKMELFNKGEAWVPTSYLNDLKLPEDEEK